MTDGASRRRRPRKEWEYLECASALMLSVENWKWRASPVRARGCGSGPLSREITHLLTQNKMRHCYLTAPGWSSSRFRVLVPFPVPGSRLSIPALLGFGKRRERCRRVTYKGAGCRATIMGTYTMFD